MHESRFARKIPGADGFKIIGYLLSAFMLMQPLLFSEVMAQGDLMITPHRVVFDGNKRSEVLNIANTGQDTAKYLISIIEYRMKEDGAFERITEPDSGQRFASPFLRYFPRSVTLGPNEAQTVKVQLIKTNQLKEGEYRSHFYFRAVPDEKPLGEEELAAADTAITIQLKAIFGITMPVIIRKGENTTEVDISDTYLEMADDTIPVLNLIFRRSGNMSAYGNVTVNHISPQGAKTQVGFVRGIAVYTPNTTRQFRLNLDNRSGVNYDTGKLQIVYSTQTDERDAKLDEIEIKL